MYEQEVLFVEKTESLLGLWGKQLEGELVPHRASSLAKFYELFEKLKSSLSLIAFGNAFMNGQPVENAIGYARTQGCTCRIFVCTSDSEARERQLQAGGENTFAVEKPMLAERIRAVLSLKPNPASVLSETFGLVDPP